MDIRKNRFKQAAGAGDTLYGIFHGLADSYVAEICAEAGFDWIVIDSEHSPFDVRTVLHHVQCMAPFDAEPIVRVPDGDPARIKKLLDAGVQSLIVPLVETGKEAARHVAATRYPPEGVRGVALTLSRASRWGRVEGYVHKANEEICLLVQVETVTGLDNLDAIVDVDGVDGVFIGPADLSASMGYLGQPYHPEVIEAIAKALGYIRGEGKIAGVLSTSPDRVSHYVEAGANMVGVGLDAALLVRATSDLVARYKGREG